MLLQVEVNNWLEYNPRSDRKVYTWFRFQNDFFMNHKIHGLSDTSKLVWIFILCEASKNFGEAMNIDTFLTSTLLRKNEADVIKSIHELTRLGVITVTNKLPNGNSTNDTNVTNVTNDTNEEIHCSNSTPLVALRPEPEPLPAKTRRLNPAEQSLNAEIWKAYSAAYAGRYGVEPVRNAAVNAKVSQLRSRLGRDAVEVVKFFLSSSNSFYARSLHAIGLCLKDAESLHTQWVKGRAITEADVKNLERANRTNDVLRRIEEGI